MVQRLQARIAVITGAANGIGRASALRLASEGADIALLDLDAAGLERLAGEVRALGRRALPIAANCAEPAAIAASFARVRAELGEPDILLNNVGQSARDRMTEFSSADLSTLDFMLDVNLKSCILCSRQVVEQMRARRSGRIINLASEAAFNGAPLCWDYAAAKGGVVGFTRALARELAPFMVTVNAVGPGLTRTRAMDELPQSVIDAVCAKIPNNTINEPEDIAASIAFFASDDARHVTGQTLLVNGANWML